MMGVTQREGECLAFIERMIAEKGYPPTCAEMADALGLKSRSGVIRLLNGLEDRGRIRRLAKRQRAIEVIPADGPVCPHCGERAGSPECVGAARAARETELHRIAA